MSKFGLTLLLAASVALVLPALAGAGPRRDRTKPETTITGASKTDTSASFSFSANEPATFECKLDAGSYASCTSPKAYSGLAAGTHTFSVRATDMGQNVDASPATHSWTIEASTPPPPPPPPADTTVCSISPANGHAAIAAAIEGCPNGATVRFPAGQSYTQADSIVVQGRSDLTIDGNGSTFRSTAPNDTSTSTPNWRIDSGANVILQGMRIVGNFTPAGRGIKSGNQFNHGVLIRGGNGVTVRDATIRNVWGDGVTTARSGWVPGNSTAGVAPRSTRLQRLTVASAARMCVAFTEQEGGWLEDSTLSDCHYAGVDLETDVGGQVMRDVHILRNKISGYYIMGIGVAGPVPGMGTPAAGDLDRIEVRGNTVGEGDTCWSPVLFSDSDVSRGPISNVIVAENDLTTQGDGVRVFDVVGGSVTGNRITTTKGLFWCGTAASPSTSVRVGRSSGVNVSGNTSLGY